MAVITQDGVVGKLRDVFPTTAQVLDNDDESSGAGASLAKHCHLRSGSCAARLPGG